MRSTRLLARAVTACCLAGCALTAAAQVDDGEMQVTQTLAPALSPTRSTTPGLVLHAGPATQTMLWRHRGALGIGVGFEQPVPDLAAPGVQARPADALLLGVSMTTDQRTQLSWQTSATELPLAERPMKVSLTFQRRSALRELRRGSLLRMQISGQTTVALKLRGGRLGVALTSRW